MKLCKPPQITIPLDIPDVAVVKTEITADRKFIITVESQAETTECGICHREIKCSYGHGGEIELRHLAILGYETYIRLKPRRGQCQTCETKPTTTQELRWYEPRSPHTKGYDAYLVKQMIHSTIEDVSLKEGVGYDAVVGALNRQVGCQIKWEEVAEIGTVGIDEIALTKGHKNYVAVITARQKNGQVGILAVLEDRKKRR